MTYAEKLKDPRWQKRRLEVFSKADWRCEDCASEIKELQVHHCYYVRSLEPWEHGDDLLICVCPDCHKFRQEKEEAIHVTLGQWLKTVPAGGLEEAAWEFCDVVIQRLNTRFESAAKVSDADVPAAGTDEQSNPHND